MSAKIKTLSHVILNDKGKIDIIVTTKSIFGDSYMLFIRWVFEMDGLRSTHIFIVTGVFALVLCHEWNQIEMFIKSNNYTEKSVLTSQKLARSNLECIIFCAQIKNCNLAAREPEVQEKYDNYKCYGYEISNLISINSNISISKTILYRRKTYSISINDDLLTTLQTPTLLCETPFVQHKFGCYYIGTNGVAFQEAEDQCDDYNNSFLAEFENEEVSKSMQHNFPILRSG